MLAAQMERQPTPKLNLAGAGSVLIGTTAAVIVVGILIGWLAGSTCLGLPRRRDPRHSDRRLHDLHALQDAL